MAKARPQLLEPIMRAAVVTPEEHMGDVIGDLNSRRGWITGMNQRGDARVIDATVPFQELLGYANRLAAMTGGRAEFSLQFDHYAPVRNLDPPHPGAAIGLRIA
jgi:elongation factor G